MSAKSFISPVVLWIHIAFLLTGMVNTLLGPILPELASRWRLEDSRAGYLFPAQFFGSVLGALLCSRCIPSWGFRPVVVLGLVLMAGGVGTFGFSSWPLALLTIFCSGVGLGLAIPSANLLVAEAFQTRRAAALNLLNFTWGLGALLWPWMASLAAGTSNLLLGLAFALMASCLAIVLSARREELDAPKSGHLASTLPGELRVRAVLGLGVLFFLYVGTETAISGWAAFHMKRLATSASRTWMLTPMLFWMPLLLGRAVAPVLLRRMSEDYLIRAGLLLTLASETTLLLIPRSALVVAAIIFAGLGLSSVFPILIAMLTRTLGADAGRFGGPIFALSGLGAATLPWLVGVVSTRYASLRAGLSVTIVCTISILVLHTVGTGTSQKR